MSEMSIENLIQLAQSYSDNGVRWHHHFLALDCQFNESARFQIILENEQTKESFVCYFEEKPMKELEQLENIFFGRARSANST